MYIDYYINYIEEKVLVIIAKQIADGKMTTKRAQEISSVVLRALSENMTVDELFKAAIFLKNYAELVSIATAIQRDAPKLIKNKANDINKFLIK